MSVYLVIISLSAFLANVGASAGGQWYPDLMSMRAGQTWSFPG